MTQINASLWMESWKYINLHIFLVISIIFLPVVFLDQMNEQEEVHLFIQQVFEKTRPHSATMGEHAPSYYWLLRPPRIWCNLVEFPGK